MVSNNVLNLVVTPAGLNRRRLRQAGDRSFRRREVDACCRTPWWHATRRRRSRESTPGVLRVDVSVSLTGIVADRDDVDGLEPADRRTPL